MLAHKGTATPLGVQTHVEECVRVKALVDSIAKKSFLLLYLIFFYFLRSDTEIIFSPTSTNVITVSCY